MANPPPVTDSRLRYEGRELLAKDFTAEKQVVATFLSTLAMSEHAPGDQLVNITLSLAELRQHVQFCQYAALAMDNASAVNADYSKMQAKVRNADRLYKMFERQEELLQGISGALAHTKSKTDEFFRVRALAKSEMTNYAKTID